MSTCDVDISIRKSIERLFEWVKENRYLGWDTYDGLNSPTLKGINNHYLQLLLLQANYYSPLNLRPILSIEKGIDLKGMALFAQAYASLYKITGDEQYLTEMKSAMRFIKVKTLKETYGHDCWASHYYPYVNIDRSTLSLETPDIIGTSQAIIALVKSYNILKDTTEKEMASSAVTYLLKELFVNDAKLSFFKYTGSDRQPPHIIINASAQALEAIVAYWQLEYNSDLKSVCERVCRTLLQTQRDDGAWDYSIYRDGSTKRVQLDFHQGYIIDGLLAYLPYSDNSKCIHNCILKASNFYKNIQFKDKGHGSYRYPLPFPIDIHNQAQGIITFSKLSHFNNKYADDACSIILWTIKNMQDRSGYFYHQKWPIITNKVPYIRWGQAWMMVALTTFLEAKGGERL